MKYLLKLAAEAITICCVVNETNAQIMLEPPTATCPSSNENETDERAEIEEEKG